MCFLNCICGLKQAPRWWYKWLIDYVIMMRFFHEVPYHSFSIYHYDNDITDILKYVDESIHTSLLNSLREYIVQVVFSIFNEWSLSTYFLGISVTRYSRGFFMQKRLLNVHVCLLASHHLRRWTPMRNLMGLWITLILIQHNIGVLSMHYITYHLEDHIYPMQFIKCASLYMTQKYNRCPP